MFDEIRFTQRFYENHYLLSLSFQIDLNKKIARFKEYEYNNIEKLDSSKFRGSIKFKEKTIKKIDKIFKLNKKQIDLIINEIDKLRFAKFTQHDYRINDDIHYQIELLEDGHYSENNYINLKYQDELIKLNDFLEEIFSFPIFDLSLLSTVITEYNYDINRKGVYSKETLKKLKLQKIDFSVEKGLFVYGYGWDIDFEEKILKLKGKEYKLLEETIDKINDLIEDYGVYNWFYPDYYEKIKHQTESSLDGPSTKFYFIFEDGKQFTIRFSSGYPDTYPQLALKVKELFNEDLLKYEFTRDLELYHKYGDNKIKSNNKVQYIKEYILTEIILKIPGILDFHNLKFPKTLYKKEEYLFEYDRIYDDELYQIKKAIISKLKECYDFLGLKYNFYIILYPIDYLDGLEDAFYSLIGSDKLHTIHDLESLNEKEQSDYLLDLWERNKWRYLEFKHFCYEDDKLREDYSKYNLDSKYILSNSYEVNQNEVKIYLKISGKKYNIVEKQEATHILTQKFNSAMKLISQTFYDLNK